MGVKQLLLSVSMSGLFSRAYRSPKDRDERLSEEYSSPLMGLDECVDSMEAIGRGTGS